MITLYVCDSVWKLPVVSIFCILISSHQEELQWMILPEEMWKVHLEKLFFVKPVGMS